MKYFFYKSRQKALCFFLATLFLSFFSGCAFWEETENAHFSLDAESKSLNAEKWLIVQNGGSGGGGVYSPTLILGQDGTDFSLEMQKNCVSALLAYPVVDGEVQKPLGAIYPYSKNLNTAGGFCAYIVDRLYRGSVGTEKVQAEDFISRFNWTAFYSLCLQKGEDNIWNLDSERIISKITSGRFSKNDIKLKQ